MLRHGVLGSLLTVAIESPGRQDEAPMKQLAMLTVEHFVESHNPMDGRHHFRLANGRRSSRSSASSV